MHNQKHITKLLVRLENIQCAMSDLNNALLCAQREIDQMHFSIENFDDKLDDTKGVPQNPQADSQNPSGVPQNQQDMEEY